MKSQNKKFKGPPLKDTSVGIASSNDDSLSRLITKKKYDILDFDIIKLLGQGSFGTVNLVRHVKTNQLFAMKTLSKQNIKGKKQIQHITNEKNILIKMKKADFCCNIYETL